MIMSNTFNRKIIHELRSGKFSTQSMNYLGRGMFQVHFSLLLNSIIYCLTNWE